MDIGFINSVCPDYNFAIAILVFFLSVFALIKCLGKTKFRSLIKLEVENDV